jgi:hypothetical protein
MADTSESIKEVAAIKKSCNIDTPLAMVMAAKLQKAVPVTYIKDIIQKKSFTFKLPYAINEKTSGIAELTKVHTMCEPEVIEYFKMLNEKYQINICKVDSSVDDNTQTISYTFEYSLEMKNGN